MPNRLGQLLLSTGALLAAGWLIWLCRFSDQTSFLPRQAPAHWIVYPKPSVPHLQAVAELPGAFRRTFHLQHVPSSALLSLQACRRCEIFVNEKLLPLPAVIPHWKRPF